MKDEGELIYPPSEEADAEMSSSGEDDVFLEDMDESDVVFIDSLLETLDDLLCERQIRREEFEATKREVDDI